MFLPNKVSSSFLCLPSENMLEIIGDWYAKVGSQEIHVILFTDGDGEALYSMQKQDWELTGSYHQLLIAKFNWLFISLSHPWYYLYFIPQTCPWGWESSDERLCSEAAIQDTHRASPFFLPFVSPNRVFLFLNVDLLYKLMGIWIHVIHFSIFDPHRVVRV